MKRPLALAILSALLLAPMAATDAAELCVATNGNDKAAGTLDAPFGTIQRAFEQAGPGDTIFLRVGTYREQISLTSKSGTEGAPITLAAAKGEKPIISGLDVLKLEWKATPQSGIFVASLDTNSITQLFYNGKPMLEARWPHCPRDTNGDWNFFSPSMWADADTTGNSYGTVSCAALAKTGWDVTGAKALLNVAHQYYCWTRQVISHSAGSKSFTYDQDLGKSVGTTDESGVHGSWNNRNKFYLFGLKQFLGAPGEWFYDAAVKQLYICSPNGKSPDESLLEIKSRPWGFTADSTCKFLTIDGIAFFATAFKFGKDDDHRSSHIIVRNNSVLYSSWTEYNRLPNEGKNTNAPAESSYPTIQADNSEVMNNTFAFGALCALKISGFDNLIENNLFHDFDLNSSLEHPVLSVCTSCIDGKTGRAKVIQNTLTRSGGIQVCLSRENNEFSMNDVSDSFLACYGGNNDTSAVYTGGTNCTGTRIHHNWVHCGYSGTPPFEWGGGIGIRGDDDTCGLTVDHNVTWNFGGPGIVIKNVKNPKPVQANRCINNTVFDHSSYLQKKAAIYLQSTWYMINSQSMAVNNLSDSIVGWWGAKPLGPVKIFSNNSVAFNPVADLVNTAWCDFRPVSGSMAIVGKGVAVEGISPMEMGKAPDIGAYQRGEASYWIPGRRDTKATYPIVPDKAQGVPANRDVLMWRPAYGATSHTVTFSTSEAGLDQNTPPTVQKTFQGEENVFTLPTLAAGKTYFWRVDAVMPDGSVVQGDLWSFTTTTRN
jgi:hypothetical protein